MVILLVRRSFARLKRDTLHCSSKVRAALLSVDLCKGVVVAEPCLRCTSEPPRSPDDGYVETSARYSYCC